MPQTKNLQNVTNITSMLVYNFQDWCKLLAVIIQYFVVNRFLRFAGFLVRFGSEVRDIIG